MEGISLSNIEYFTCGLNIEVRVHTQQQFDPNWIRNAIEEPLDEMDIQASTRLE